MLRLILDDEELSLDPVVLNAVCLLVEHEHILRRAERGSVVLRFDRRRKGSPERVTMERHILTDSDSATTGVQRIRAQRRRRTT